MKTVAEKERQTKGRKIIERETEITYIQVYAYTNGFLDRGRQNY